MSIIQMLLKEMDQEALTTKKMLERVPNNQFDWQPHAKSMTIRQLTTHIAELPGWVVMSLNTDGLDFAEQPYQPEIINNTTELLQYFEKTLAHSKQNLATATDEQLLPEWTLRHGDMVLYVGTKGEMIRVAFSQIVHHRAQLGVYLRLLNIPIPGSYGPSADEH